MRITAKKSLGQNFLINEGVLDRLVASAGVGEKDTVLEVGPGTGNLTKKLAATGARVIAVEKDARLVAPLKELFAGFPNVEIVEADILELTTDDLQLTTQKKSQESKIVDSRKLFVDGNYKVVANIPYYITSHFLKTVFESWPRPELVVLTIQKEVAERIVAGPPHMNLLALSIRYYAEPEIIMTVSRGSFRPVPNVDSAILRLTPRHNLQSTDYRLQTFFFKCIRAGFAHKRKKLLSNLSQGLKIQKTELEERFKALSLDITVRPEELSLERWLALTTAVRTSWTP